MTVQLILKSKGTNVATIQPHRTLTEAIMMLAEKRIGALVVSDASKTVLGILSERDIIRALAEDDLKALSRPVSAYMTAHVITCKPDAAINDVMEIMTDGKFRHIPVVAGGQLAGIVSIGDVVKSRLSQMALESRALQDYIVGSVHP